ncbi:MFS transporter [Pseudomonas phytophila]|uniref:MFS transporter n=1 Tax=Pseudomonas phytophila TaxID=2867264 RepID=A0ABY6FMT0_9PSED|nr:MULTISPECIES: MFS transporter [Pseudomonas]MCD5989209.1 MFS transporter [Pseudomonas quasicaspiana]UXZ99267.1 MFS transporter [Pseudomonas phytophila]
MTDNTLNLIDKSDAERLPWTALLALAMAGFLTILTEALPAGLLPLMSADLKVSPTLVGQLITVYAVGSLLAAIPLTALTRNWRRRPLLLIAIGGFAVVNSITALSDDYGVTLVSRFFAGVFAGLLWSLLAGYASRLVPEHLRGRAIAVAMVGTPLALSIGIPAGTLLGSVIGWRWAFGIMSLLSLGLVIWARLSLADFPGQTQQQRLSIRQVFVLPGIRPVLLTTLMFVLAHNVLYTYIAPLLEPAGLSEQIDRVLLAFGVAALGGIWLVGVLIDRWLRELVLISIALFLLTAFAWAINGENSQLIYLYVIIWGLAFGGAATLFQTASAITGGAAADVSQSMIVTVWNLGIAGGGLAGGLLLQSIGVQSFNWLVCLLLISALIVSASANRAGFPSSRQT